LMPSKFSISCVNLWWCHILKQIYGKDLILHSSKYGTLCLRFILNCTSFDTRKPSIERDDVFAFGTWMNYFLCLMIREGPLLPECKTELFRDELWLASGNVFERCEAGWEAGGWDFDTLLWLGQLNFRRTHRMCNLHMW
jgi:hypothetical protein